VNALRAAFETKYADLKVEYSQSGWDCCVSEPRPLLTFTMRGLADSASNGRNACVTATAPKVLVSNTLRTAGNDHGCPGAGLVPRMPALLTSASRWGTRDRTSSTAAAIELSEVTSRVTASRRPGPAGRSAQSGPILSLFLTPPNTK
jgi:hypothetical protein